MPQLEKSPQTSARTHWLAPSLEIARFTLASYARSGWLLLDILLIWFIYSIFFSASKISIHGFFDIAIPAMVVETTLGSSILVHRSMKSNLYLPLARLSSRSPYLYGIMIASSALRIALYIMLLLMVTTAKNIIDINWLNIIGGSCGLLLICILCTLLTITLSRPIATRPAQIIFMVWIVIVLYTNTRMALSIASYLQIFQLPLKPIALCDQLSSQNTIDGWTVAGILLMLAYMAAIIAIARYWFSKRDLYLN